MKHFPDFPAESGIGYIYFAKLSDQLYKIGQCEDPAKRKKGHKTTDFSFSYESVHETVEYKACEAFLKARFEGKRVMGAEETFSITRTDIDSAMPEALQYADALHRGRNSFNELRKKESAEAEIPATEELIALHEQLKNIYGAIDTLESKADLLKLRLALEVGEHAGIAGIVTFQTRVKVDLVNRAELKEILMRERPDLYERFWQPTAIRAFCIQ